MFKVAKDICLCRAVKPIESYGIAVRYVSHLRENSVTRCEHCVKLRDFGIFENSKENIVLVYVWWTESRASNVTKIYYHLPCRRGWRFLRSFFPMTTRTTVKNYRRRPWNKIIFGAVKKIKKKNFDTVRQVRHEPRLSRTEIVNC